MSLIRGNQLDLLAPCTNAEARELTDRIKAAVEQVWALLLEAHERAAWRALGYTTWEEYVRGEFHMARRTSYQLLDQGRVIRAIADATGGVCSPEHIAVTDAEARDIKPALPQVVEAVRERVAELDEPDDDTVTGIVREEVAAARESTREDRLRQYDEAREAPRQPIVPAVEVWSFEERELQARLEAGETVVVSFRCHENLIAWARERDLFVRIDRQSDWGNRFEMGPDGDRTTVIANYRDHYLPYKPSLHARLDELKGKALGCWCAPEPCHGDVLVVEVDGDS